MSRDGVGTGLRYSGQRLRGLLAAWIALLFDTAKDHRVSLDRPVNVAALRGARIMTVFAFLWWGVGVASIRQPYVQVLSIAGLVFSIALAYRLGQHLQRRAMGLGWGLLRPGPIFWLFVAADVILLVVVIAGANAIGRLHLIPGAIAVLIGLVFIPLGRMFHRPSYQVVALGLSVIGLATIVLILLNILTWEWWLVVPGIGSALVIWTDAVLAVVFPED